MEDGHLQLEARRWRHGAVHVDADHVTTKHHMRESCDHARKPREKSGRAGGPSSDTILMHELLSIFEPFGPLPPGDCGPTHIGVRTPGQMENHCLDPESVLSVLF